MAASANAAGTIVSEVRRGGLTELAAACGWDWESVREDGATLQRAQEDSKRSGGARVPES